MFEAIGLQSYIIHLQTLIMAYNLITLECLCVLLQVIIFDFGTEFYIWQGKAVSMEQRKLGLKLSKQLYEKGYDYTESPINPLSPLRSRL